MKPRIYLVVERADGRRSEIETGDQVTQDMQAVAEDLLHTLTTGNRPPLKDLYDLCAKAFGTTRDDAKKRLLRAAYGQNGSARDLRLAVKETRLVVAATAQYPDEETAVNRTASQRALLCLHDGGYNGLSAGEVGAGVWPERERRPGRGVSVNGGGDYAAQMLLGRLKKAGLVEYASSEGSTRWCLSTKGRGEVRTLNGENPPAIPARVPSPPRATGTEACTCGCAIEAHGGDPEYPGSTSCTECGCIAYEADLNASEES